MRLQSGGRDASAGPELEVLFIYLLIDDFFGKRLKMKFKWGWGLDRTGQSMDDICPGWDGCGQRGETGHETRADAPDERQGKRSRFWPTKYRSQIDDKVKMKRSGGRWSSGGHLHVSVTRAVDRYEDYDYPGLRGLRRLRRLRRLRI